MKLKSFSSVNICTRTQFDVFTKEKAGNEYIESFTVDYSKAHIQEEREKLLKRLDYEKRDALDRIDDPYDGIEIALVNMDTVVTYDAISGDATSISVAEFLESYLPEAINYEMAYI